MKTSIFLLVGALLFAGCERTVVEHRRPFVTRRCITYSDREPYYRAYYREPGSRFYYRRHYDDDPRYVERVNTRRYYYAPGPIDRSYGF